MKKMLRTGFALLLTAALLLTVKSLWKQEQPSAPGPAITRIWLLEREPAVAAWVRSFSAGYEKETGSRVYLRAAMAEEATAARTGDGIQPDLLLYPGTGFPVALRGYALILRDDTAAVATPAPTSALFFPPPSTPGPSPTPAPTPDPASFTAVLAPEELMDAVPGTVRSHDPAGDLSRGKAKAALLTAGQAAQLTFGFRAFAVPEGAGLVSVCAQAFTPEGQRFLDALLRENSQRALRQAGLYSPFLPLYGPEDPLRRLIDDSRVSFWAAP